MDGAKNRISSPQLFFLIFLYMLSGMLLYGGGKAVAVLFACLFCVCVCVIAAALCGHSFSAREFFARAFGGGGVYARYICAFFAVYSLLRTLASFAGEISAFHADVSAPAIMFALVLLAFFAVRRGFCVAARFAETCVFPLVLALLLSLLGGGGAGLDFAFSEDLLFTGFDIIGAVPAFFSLFLRNVTPESGKMSDFAKNSAFHPSPVACGSAAVLAAGLTYAFFCFTGWGNIMVSFLLWFASLARVFVFAITVCDLACVHDGAGVRGTATVCAFAAAWILLGGLFGEMAAPAAVFANVLFPCVLFAVVMLKNERKERMKNAE